MSDQPPPRYQHQAVTLARLAESFGGVESLAAHLGMTAGELQPFVTGNAQMPMEQFVAAIKLIPVGRGIIKR